MTAHASSPISTTLALLALIGAPADAAGKRPVRADPIRSAMSAGPAAVAARATIARVNPDGTMTTLRQGSNGFTCMPDNPATPGPDPMCLDANAMTWAMAWIGHKPPPTDRPGLMYMLEGGTDFSNVDPYASKPDGAWIKTGPHVMVVGSAAILQGYPAGARPDTRVPYVMWAGTPYAHLMVPVR
ncbi:MAG: hypothetical protein KGL54_09735 [Sphingomonadales bacterium]|nr:hypothetical protein [Sphingomonadales bacterium]